MMQHRILQLAVILAVLLMACVTNGESMVHLRIEGDEETLFDGKILTKAMKVTSESGETDKCDGTNNRLNSVPGATVIGALHSAAMQAAFTWDGWGTEKMKKPDEQFFICFRTYWPSFDDYSITQIGRDYQTNSKHWSILLNFEYIQVGGCQQQVEQGDQILFAYNVAKKSDFLQLKLSQETIPVGIPLTVIVADARTGAPISDATVAHQITDADGQAIIIFRRPGSEKLQAEHPDAVRWNTIFISVSH